VSNLLIVESDGDKYFIEALLKDMNIKLKPTETVCSIDDYECLGGIDEREQKKLEKKLKFLSNKIDTGQIEEIDTIGIIFYADKIGIEQRKKDIQDKIDLVFGKDTKVKFRIYIMNIEGVGELEDILKAIKIKKSPYADCLHYWKECLNKNNMEVSDKIFNKFWINNYIMYDTCTSSKHRGQKSKYCTFEYAMKEKKIWNFDHKVLNDLKEFLQEIGEQK
jgi:hypothetical protein